MALKQFTYEGHGINKMMDVCYRHHLTPENSTLYVRDPNDLDSYWRVTVKPGFVTDVVA